MFGQVWSIRDFINFIKEKPCNDAYGRVTWKNMLKGDFAEELAALAYNVVIPGSMGHSTPCASVSGLQRILNLFPGKVGKQYRDEADNTFRRVIAGDVTLIKTIQDNNASQAPTQQLFREELAREGVQVATTTDMLEIQERQAKIRLMNAEAAKINLDVGHQLEQHFTRVAKGKLDEHAQLYFQDMYINMATQITGATNRLALTNGAPPPRPLTISVYAAEKGIRLTNGQAQAVGRLVAAQYRNKYGRDPTEHAQKVNGSVVQVKSYTTEHADLIDAAIEDVLATASKKQCVEIGKYFRREHDNN